MTNDLEDIEFLERSVDNTFRSDLLKSLEDVVTIEQAAKKILDTDAFEEILNQFEQKISSNLKRTHRNYLCRKFQAGSLEVFNVVIKIIIIGIQRIFFIIILPRGLNCKI